MIILENSMIGRVSHREFRLNSFNRRQGVGSGQAGRESSIAPTAMNCYYQSVLSPQMDFQMISFLLKS